MFLKTAVTASSGADGLWEVIVALVTHKNKKRGLPREGGGGWTHPLCDSMSGKSQCGKGETIL